VRARAAPSGTSASLCAARRMGGYACARARQRVRRSPRRTAQAQRQPHLHALRASFPRLGLSSRTTLVFFLRSGVRGTSLWSGLRERTRGCRRTGWRRRRRAPRTRRLWTGSCGPPKVACACWVACACLRAGGLRARTKCGLVCGADAGRGRGPQRYKRATRAAAAP